MNRIDSKVGYINSRPEKHYGPIQHNKDLSDIEKCDGVRGPVSGVLEGKEPCFTLWLQVRHEHDFKGRLSFCPLLLDTYLNFEEPRCSTEYASFRS